LSRAVVFELFPVRVGVRRDFIKFLPEKVGFTGAPGTAFLGLELKTSSIRKSENWELKSGSWNLKCSLHPRMGHCLAIFLALIVCLCLACKLPDNDDDGRALRAWPNFHPNEAGKITPRRPWINFDWQPTKGPSRRMYAPNCSWLGAI